MSSIPLLKLTLVVPELKVADVRFNLSEMLKALPKSNPDLNQLIIFPELALTGKTCGDLFLQPTLLDAARLALDELIGACREKQIWMLVGLPLVLNSKLYNSAALLSPEGLKAFVV